MADMALDTHAFVKTLTAAGMPEAQAEAVTSVVRQSHEIWLERLVTKEDLRSGLGETEARLKLALADSEGKFKVALADSESKLKLALADAEGSLRVALAETKADLMKWMIGTIGGAVIINAMTIIGAMLALTKMAGH